jgi:hypothetical protein
MFMKNLFFITVLLFVIQYCFGQNLSYIYNTEGLTYPDWLNDPDYLAKNDNPNVGINISDEYIGYINNFAIVKVSCSKTSTPFKEEDIYLAVFNKDILTDLCDLPDYYEDQFTTAVVKISIVNDKNIIVYYTYERYNPGNNALIEEQKESETHYSITTSGKFKIEQN